MKTIELTDEAYADLLELKNHISMKTRQITNDKALKNPTKNRRTMDYEPEFTVSECISEVVKSIWNEQETGEVNFIT